MKNSELKQKAIYSYSKLKRLKIEIVRLQANRHLKESTIEAKMKSIENVGGVITPGVIIPASECVDQGLSIERWNGTSIDVKAVDLSKMVVCIDGNHRHEAVLRLNKRARDAEKVAKKSAEIDTEKSAEKDAEKSTLTYDNCFFIPQCAIDDISQLLKQSNIAITPWSAMDFLTNLIAEKRSSGVDLSKLEWVVRSVKGEECSEVAAWMWANLSVKRVPTKARYMKSAKDRVALEDLADIKTFKSGMALYEVVSHRFTRVFSGLKCVAKFFVERLSELTADGSDNEAAIGKLDQFIKGIHLKDIEQLEGYKTSKANGKQETQITNKLQELYGASI